MKTSFLIAAGAALATAQDLNSIPECGRSCVASMLEQAQQLGCASADAACLCGNANFGYGLRDCSNEACGEEVGQQVVAYGIQYCQAGLGSNAQSSGASSVLAGAASATSTGSDASRTGSPTEGGDDNASRTGSAITTSALTALVSQSDTTFTTTTGSTTIYAGESGAGGIGGAIGSATGSAASRASSARDSASSAVDSAESSATDAANSAISSATDAVNSASSSVDSAVSSASTAAAGSESSTAGGAIMTAAPMLAMGALAALAAL